MAKNIIYNKLKIIDEFGGTILYYKTLRDLEFEEKKFSKPINVLNASCAQYMVLEVY